MTEEDPEHNSPAPEAAGATPWTPPAPEHLQAMLPQYDAWQMIGCGGMGAVYKARQISLDRSVAIKVLPLQAADDEVEFVARFKNEARTMARMNHPAIVSVHDFGETGDGLLYFVMEYIDGTDVFKMIHAQRKLPPEHALAITAHVCDALAYAHEHHVIHRDIKPANILINMEGAVKVADFGLASMHDPSADTQQEGSTMGTPDYVAPEVLVLGMRVDGRADLFSVGVMLHNMLTGEIPHASSQTASQQTGCDARFDAIVRKAMEHDVTRRYQSAREIRRDLDRILTVPVAKEQPAPKPRGGMQPRPMPQQYAPPPKSTPWGLMVATLVVLGGAALFFMNRGSPPTPSPAVETVETAPPKTRPVEASTPPAPIAPVVMQTDPNAPKGSPLSGFPVLSHAGHHYQVVEAQTSFDEAQKHAASLGAHLLTITSQEEMDWLDQTLTPLLRQVPQSMASIGAVRENGVWKWTTGEPYQYTNWRDDGSASKAEPERKFILKLTARAAPFMHWGTGLIGASRAFILEWDGTPKNDPAPPPTPTPPPVPAGPIVTESEGTKRLRELETQFRAALERDVISPHRTALAGLNINYIAALDRAIIAAAASAPEALALSEEKQRVESNGPLPTEEAPDASPTLKTLRSTYRSSLRPLDLTRHNGIITFFLRYEDVLKSLEVEWTKSARIEDAKLASARRGEIGRERVGMLNEAKELVTDGRELVLKGRDRFISPESFQPPVEFTIVAKTDSTNLRLAYTGRQAIFNWDGGLDELRFDGDVGGARNAKGQGRIPENTYVTIHWRIMPHMQTLSVDGKRRYLHFGDYSKLNKPIEIFSAGSTVTLKSLKVRPLDLKALEDDASSVAEMKEQILNTPNWTGKVTLPAGTYRPLRRINIGAPGLKNPKAQFDDQRGDVISQPGTRIENVRFHLHEGSWKATGGLFRDVKISADLGGTFEAHDSLFQDCAFSKEGAWYIAWFSSKWTFTNCVFTGSFLQNWRLGDVGLKLDACTFHDVDFIPIGFKEDAGAEVGKDWLSIKNCRFVNCRVPESFALATKNCVFEKCTFGDPENNLPLKSPLNAGLYLRDPVNQPKAGDGRTFAILPAIQAPPGVGASVKHRHTGTTLNFE